MQVTCLCIRADRDLVSKVQLRMPGIVNDLAIQNSPKCPEQPLDSVNQVSCLDSIEAGQQVAQCIFGQQRPICRSFLCCEQQKPLANAAKHAMPNNTSMRASLLNAWRWQRISRPKVVVSKHVLVVMSNASELQPKLHFLLAELLGKAVSRHSFYLNSHFAVSILRLTLKRALPSLCLLSVEI